MSTLITEFRYENYKTFVVEIFLLSKCQLKCPYCFVNNENKEKEFQYDDYNYSLDEFEKLLISLNGIDKFKDIKFLFMGGEPTIHPQYFEIINLIEKTIDKDRKFSIKSMTNGLKLRDSNFRKKIESYADFLQLNFSLHFDYFDSRLLDILNNIDNNVKFKIMFIPKYRDIIADLLVNKKIKSDNVIINKLYQSDATEMYNYTEKDSKFIYDWNKFYGNIKTDIFYRIYKENLFKYTSYLCVYPNGYFFTRNKYKQTKKYDLNIYKLPSEIIKSYLNRVGEYKNETFYIQKKILDQFNFNVDLNTTHEATFYDLGIGPVTI